MVMSANSGVALSLVSRPAFYPDPDFSHRVRDAVIESITVPEDSPVDGSEAPSTGTTAVVAAALGARLQEESPDALTKEETALLRQWLRRLADASASTEPADTSAST